MSQSGYKKWILAAAVIVLAVVVFLFWQKQKKPALQRYQMVGTVVSVTPASKTITVRNQDIPGFMRAMVMDYQFKEPPSLTQFKPGDEIRATLVTNGEDVWVLENSEPIPKH